VRVVVPVTPRPSPDCDTVAIPENELWPWVEVVVTVQFPARFRAELVELGALELFPLLQAVRERMPMARSTLRLAEAMRFIRLPSLAKRELDRKDSLITECIAR
jgi:hypothetical protein